MPGWITRRRVAFACAMVIMITLMGALYGVSKDMKPNAECLRCRIIGTREANIAQSLFALFLSIP